MNAKPQFMPEPDVDEVAEWIEAFDQVVNQEGATQGTRLLQAAQYALYQHHPGRR